MSKKITVSENEILEALSRSGYLLESEVSSILFKHGFFIETNQVIEDPLTSKSREIDLLAEYYDWDADKADSRVSAKIKLVFEIKNNLFPIVFITNFESSPNIEDWLGLKQVLTVPKYMIYEMSDYFYENLIESAQGKFTQYCSFQKKKENDELMALHPDNINEGLSKITQYCEESVEYLEELKDNFLRHFLYLPVLLINDNLYEFNGKNLKQVESSFLVYNYYFKKEPRMAYVQVITKKRLPDFIKNVIDLQTDLTNKMLKSILKS